jgi:hypothetical protein
MPRLMPEPLDRIHIRIRRSTNEKLHEMFDNTELGWTGAIREILDRFVYENDINHKPKLGASLDDL